MVHRRSIFRLTISILAVLASDVSASLLVARSVPAASVASDLRSRISGRWMADILIPGGDLHLQARFVEADGDLQAFATVPALGMIDQRASSIEIAESEITSSFGRTGFRVEIDWTSDGDVVTGRFGFLEGPPSLLELGKVDFAPTRIPNIRLADGATRHDATLEIPGGGELPMSLVFAEIGDRSFALVDIPAQGIAGLHLLPAEVPVDAKAGTIGWRIPVGVDAVFMLEPAGDSWRGRFRQGGFDVPIAFTRADDAAVVATRRPQEPVPPFPYENVEVVVETKEGHELSGTLVIPSGPVPERGFPSVVMATGSGPQNRDEELLGHRPFLVLADRFARAGIASLRLDDRGIGGSTGEFSTATTSDFANDIASGLAFIKGRSEIDPDRSGVLGHSEGGAVVALIAAGLASNHPNASPAFVISIAGCGVDGGRVVEDQVSRMYSASGLDDAVVSRMSVLQSEAIALARAKDVDVAALGDAMVALQRAQLELTGSDVDDDMDDSLRSAGLELMTSPWMREFLTLDPAMAWREVEVPILALNGTLDLQVSAEMNLDAIQAAVADGDGDVRIVRLVGLNHLLQPAETGLPAEYGVIETTMDETAMKIMAEFIETIGRDASATSNRE